MLIDMQLEVAYLERQVRRAGRFLKGLWDKYGPQGFDQLVTVSLDEVEARINEEDDGIFRCYLDFRNLSRRILEMIGLHIHQVRLARVSLSEIQPMFSSNGKEVAPRTTESLMFEVPIRAKDVRRIANNMKEAQNIYSSPDNSMEIRGFFRIRHGWRERKLRFEFNTLPKYYVAPPAEEVFAESS